MKSFLKIMAIRSFFRSWGTWGTENLKETACELTKDTTIFIMGKDRNLNSLNF